MIDFVDDMDELNDQMDRLETTKSNLTPKHKNITYNSTTSLSLSNPDTMKRILSLIPK